MYMQSFSEIKTSNTDEVGLGRSWGRCAGRGVGWCAIADFLCEPHGGLLL